MHDQLKTDGPTLGLGHGEGAHDGTKVVVKRTLTHEQLKTTRPTLDCVLD